MILEKLTDYTTIVISRKIILCKLIKEELIKNKIITSDETIANAVAKLPNDYFLTTVEKIYQKIILDDKVMKKLLEQNPNMINEVLNQIS